MGYGNYRAKKTLYNGTWYDSNLEARVAEALDALGFTWEYHRQCFRDRRFPYGQYTPDFHLPNSDTYIEVCGVYDERHEANVRVLCEILGVAAPNDTRMLVVCGREGGTTSHRSGGGARQGSPYVWRAADGRASTELMALAGVR